MPLTHNKQMRPEVPDSKPSNLRNLGHIRKPFKQGYLDFKQSWNISKESKMETEFIWRIVCILQEPKQGPFLRPGTRERKPPRAQRDSVPVFKILFCFNCLFKVLPLLWQLWEARGRTWLSIAPECPHLTPFLRKETLIGLAWMRGSSLDQSTVGGKGVIPRG